MEHLGDVAERLENQRRRRVGQRQFVRWQAAQQRRARFMQRRVERFVVRQLVQHLLDAQTKRQLDLNGPFSYFRKITRTSIYKIGIINENSKTRWRNLILFKIVVK